MLCRLWRGTSQDASTEACASLEDGVLVGGPPNADGVVGEAPSEIVVGLSFSTRLANAGPRRPRLPNWLMLGSYVLSQEWDRPLTDIVALGPKVSWEIIDRRSPFNKRESSVTYMCDSTPLFSEYRWWLVLRSNPSPSPSIWIGSLSSAWPKTRC